MLDSARMISFDDERWNHLTGGYKNPFDPRPSLQKLDSHRNTATAGKNCGRSCTTKATLGTPHMRLYRNL